MSPAASFWSGRRVLLTGHTGFKGAWAALWLERLGAKVTGLALAPVIDLWSDIGRPADSGEFLDIRDRDAAARTFAREKPEIVIHMAAQALVHPSYDDPAATFSANVMGLVHVLDAARRSPGLRAFVNVTSDKCYENREQLWAYREDEPMGGSDPYSASKGCAELVTASYRRSFFKDVAGPQLASGRAGNVIGGGDMSLDRLVPDCIRAFSAGKPVLIRNPLATRPWQHVLEPVCGYLTLAQALVEQGPAVAEGWNFGPTEADAWPVGAVVAALARRWGEGARAEPDPKERPREAMLLRVDATKARVRLKWRPRLDVATALDWTVDWHRAVDAGASARATSHAQIEAYESLGASAP